MEISEKHVCVPDVGTIADLQFMYDVAFPGNSIIDSTFDGYQVANDGIYIDIDNITVYPHKQMKFWQDQRGLTPVLRTAMPEKRQPGLVESVLAFNKRNKAAPNYQECVSEYQIIPDVIKKTRSVFFDDDIIDGTDTNTHEGAARWWQKQTHTAQKQMLAGVKSLSNKDVSTYTYMIKNDVKPQLNLSPQTEYAALQTVIYPDKEVNAIFGPVMKEINLRMQLALKPHVVYNTRLTSSQLDDAVEFLDVREDYDSLEIDFSKFDKSKTSLHIRSLIALYNMFGLDKYLGYLWEVSQGQTLAIDRTNGLIARLLYQQKSGNCDTYGSNTWSAALALLDCLPLEKAKFMIFGGDDSLILFPKGIKYDDPCKRLAGVWNFDVKQFPFKNNMFCGKFLLKIGERYKFAPCPYKLLTKLGRKCVKDGDLLSEIFISIGDNYRSYADYRVLEALNVAVVERYMVPQDVLFGLCALKRIIGDFDLFRTLFNYNGKFKLVDVDRRFEW